MGWFIPPDLFNVSRPGDDRDPMLVRLWTTVPVPGSAGGAQRSGVASRPPPGAQRTSPPAPTFAVRARTKSRSESRLR